MVFDQANYTTQTLIKSFIKIPFVQDAMCFQSYRSRKQEAADFLVFNKALLTHAKSYENKQWHSRKLMR